MTLIVNKKIVIALALVLFLGLFAAVANANNSWSKYHWDKSTEESVANPLVLTDNTTPAWSDSLSGASSDWNLSVLLNEVVDGTNTACDPVIGQVEVCNDTYGTNGWLGIAQVWVYRGKDGHIAQALVKMNDTYFTGSRNTSAWRN
ncbi:hypothetical protein IIC45_02090, partial [Patescibacteria group bacterium]|nr:hypothetical protein [Patescibacteria group bacterium]